jgi:membrane-associated phospholipid phosphatase
LSDEQRAIALFWSDDPVTTATPPGHWVSIATQVLRAERTSLATAVSTYALLGIAVNDAFIACWAAKYRFNLLRPVTFIQRLIEPGWLPLLTTPPFPEHPSGHSVQSAAAATVLAEIFGDDHAFTDHTHDGRGLLARAFASFDDAAAEAAISRLYGGIHFRPAIELGMAQGRAIGAAVNALGRDDQRDD